MKCRKGYSNLQTFLIFYPDAIDSAKKPVVNRWTPSVNQNGRAVFPLTAFLLFQKTQQI
jgi:hypothetical protein